MSSKRLKINTT